MVHHILKIYITLALFVVDMAAEPNLLWNIRWDKMQNESGYKHLDRDSLVFDSSLPDSKKENRILPIIMMADEPLLFEVECVMDDYDMEGGVPNFRSSFNDQRSENKWRTVIEDKQQALWSTNFNLTKDDVGKQTITCDYEQGTLDQKYYSKSITLTFEIYITDGSIEKNLECQADQETCGGFLSISYKGGVQRNELVISKLSNQASKLHEGSTYIEGKTQNNFTIEADYDKLSTEEKNNYHVNLDPHELCGCEKKVKVKPPSPSSIENENDNEFYSDVNVIVNPIQPSPQSESFNIFNFLPILVLFILFLPILGLLVF